MLGIGLYTTDRLRLETHPKPEELGTYTDSDMSLDYSENGVDPQQYFALATGYPLMTFADDSDEMEGEWSLARG